MTLKIKAEYLPRYKQIAQLLMKYGRSDMVREMGVHHELTQEGLDAGAAEAHELAHDFERMGPTFIKLGQILSARTDILPLPYTEALAHLQDEVAPFPFEKVEQIVLSEMGVRINKAFSEFGTQPVAAASLGQVHHARLRDGTPVAVKVQRPDIRDNIAADLDLLETLADFLDRHTRVGKRYGFLTIAKQLRKTLLRELDYLQEAANLDQLKQNMADFPDIIVPASIPDYTTSRVLTMEYVSGTKITHVSPLVFTEVDGLHLSDEIFHAFMKQIVVDGIVHADPHAGNVYLTHDHRVALMDLGMVIHIPPNMQENLVKLLLAISEGRGEDAASLAIKLGYVTDEFEEQEVRIRISQLVAENRHSTLERMRVGALMMEICRATSENGLRVPSEIMMVGKALYHLDEIGRRLAPNFEPNVSIRQHAHKLLEQRMRRDLSFTGIVENFVEMQKLLQRLPVKMNDLLDLLTDNKIAVKVDAIDESRLIEGIQKIANRITLGLILAALIVGAALIMRVETTWTILGYPGLALLFFLAAAAGGVALAWSILFHDEKAKKKRRR